MIAPKQPRPTPSEERQAYADVTTRDPWCNRCGRPGIERDHRQNRSQGGLTAPSNLQGLCRACHAWKNANPADAMREGFAVPGWARPEMWPAWRASVNGWVIYYDKPDRKGRWWRGITDSTAHLIMNGGTA